MISEEMIQAISKHFTGDAKEFAELRERFEDFNNFRSDAAAALGYLIAKDELEAAKEEEEEEELDVYDEAVEVIKKYCHPPGNNSVHTATDEIFTLIYEWLGQELGVKGYQRDWSIRNHIKELFKPFVIEKPE